MNILQVVPYFARAWAYGGPPRSVYELSRELVRRGHSVTVLTTDAHHPGSRADRLCEDLEGIEIHRFPNLSNYIAWRNQLFLPRGTGAFLRKHSRAYDVIHLHMFRTLQDITIHRFATKNRIPYVFSPHGSLPRIVRYKIPKALFDAVAGKRLLRDAKRVIALSEAERTQCLHMGVPSRKISIVYNGVDPADYQDLPPPGSFAESFGLQDRKLVTYIGRLNARKGLDYLLQAFHRLSQSRKDVTLVMVGPDDGYLARLQKLTQALGIMNRVVFTGLITMPAKLNILVDSDLIVYPASNEVFGLVPFEALLCGRPIVVTNDSGCGEIVAKARAGFTVPFGNPLLLSQALEECLNNGAEVGDMVSRGRSFVLEQMNWKGIAGNMEAVYGEASSSYQESLAPNA